MTMRRWRLHESIPWTTPLLALAALAACAALWQFSLEAAPWLVLGLIPVCLFVLSAAFGHRLPAALLSVTAGLILALPALLVPGTGIWIYLCAAVVVSVWAMAIVTPGESKAVTIAYLPLLLIAAPGLYWFAMMSGSNTQGGTCEWVDATEANWSWEGSPCRMDWAEFVRGGFVLSLPIMILGFGPFVAVAVFFALRQGVHGIRARFHQQDPAAKAEAIQPRFKAYFTNPSGNRSRRS